MTKPLLAILLLFTVSMRGYPANPDDAAWLIYDVSYGDYFLLRVDMKTARTGYANVAGGNKYAGRRFTGQYGRFDVAMLEGKVSVNKPGAEPFMVGTINASGDEFSGEFFSEDGSSAGRFVGALQGFTTVHMDLYQLCKESPSSSDSYQCVNRGTNELCRHPRRDKKSTFFTEQNCLDEIGGLEPPTQGLASSTPRFSEDPSGTWLFYDEYYKEYVVGRLVTVDTEGSTAGKAMQGTFVFSGVYYGWDEPDGFFKAKSLWFGRRNLGDSIADKDERDRFYISLDRKEIMFEHGYKNAIFGFVDLPGGKMRGNFHPGERESLQNGRTYEFNSFGKGVWSAEKKSDDPNFDFPVFQICASGHKEEDFRNHACRKVSDVRADGSNRPQCAIGYRSGSITSLSEDKCRQFVKAKRQRVQSKR